VDLELEKSTVWRVVNSAKILFVSWFAGLILVETIYFGSKLDNVFFLLSFYLTH
jgi:hypothetical protein